MHVAVRDIPQPLALVERMDKETLVRVLVLQEGLLAPHVVSLLRRLLAHC